MKPDDDQISRHTVISDLSPSDPTNESTSHPRGSHESFSVFGDTACGEPLCVQKLNLDFTPVEDLDNDFVQRKCCAFWDYLNSRTDLHYLMVMPEQKAYDLNRTSELEPSSQLVVAEPPPEPDLKETTAVSMLEFVEGKGLIDRAFEAKLPQSMCSLGSREYRENELPIKFKPTPPKKKDFRPCCTDQGQAESACDHVCRCSGVCISCRGRTVPAATPGPSAPSGSPAPLLESAPDVQIMCSRMHDWDKNHPKSMEPPGHPPPLSRCVMQRKVTTW